MHGFIPFVDIADGSCLAANLLKPLCHRYRDDSLTKDLPRHEGAPCSSSDVHEALHSGVDKSDKPFGSKVWGKTANRKWKACEHQKVNAQRPKHIALLIQCLRNSFGQTHWSQPYVIKKEVTADAEDRVGQSRCNLRTWRPEGTPYHQIACVIHNDIVLMCIYLNKWPTCQAPQLVWVFCRETCQIHLNSC